MTSLPIRSKVRSVVALAATAVCCFWIASAVNAQTTYNQASVPANAATQENKEDQLINELFVGEKIYIQDKGEWVYVFTPSFTKAKDAKEIEFASELKYGVTDRLQVSGELPFSIVNPDVGHQEGGLGDISLAANYNFIQTDNYALAVRSDFLLPTGSERRMLGEGEFVWTPSLLSSFRVGKGEIYGGIGEEFGENHNHFDYSIAGAYPWKRFVGVLEFTGFAGDGDNEIYFAPGFYVNIREHMDFGFGIPIGLTHDSDNYRLVAKLVFEF